MTGRQGPATRCPQHCTRSPGWALSGTSLACLLSIPSHWGHTVLPLPPPCQDRSPLPLATGTPSPELLALWGNCQGWRESPLPSHVPFAGQPHLMMTGE